MDGDPKPLPGASSGSTLGTPPGASSATTSLSPVVPAKPFTPMISNRTSPFPPTSTSSAIHGHMASAFAAPAHALRPITTSQIPYSSATSPDAFLENDQPKPIGTPFSISPTACCVLVRRLPLNTTEDSLRLIFLFSKELQRVVILPPEQSEDSGFVSAVAEFKTLAGAQEAKTMLDGKSMLSSDATLIVEVMNVNVGIGRAPGDVAMSTSVSTSASSTASSVTSSRQPSRFNGAFPVIDKTNGHMNMNGIFQSNGDLSATDSSAHYHSIFSPQSPIGNHLTDRVRMSGKALINNDAGDDDETRELLKDPVAYAENGTYSNNQRRATAPAIPVGRLAALSLNTSPPPPIGPVGGHVFARPQPQLTNGPRSAHPGPMSPPLMAGSGASLMYGQHFRSHTLPPANPADQNPPCNTLYVGNLPIDTAEEELKAMFSKQRGYKRLCFRTKQNGPMCFVEFEDISTATRALHELYGHPLHNSVKGGIRLSFSKNPLGVRSNQNPSQMGAGMGGLNGVLAGSSNGFTTASGPPPGLSAPPGLGANRVGFNGPNYPASNFSPTNNWNMAHNYLPMAAGGSPPVAAGVSRSLFPPHMMGR